ncbi:MAG: selenocysteine-specific translation elongation factor, partial [Gemmobacter sp.]|nr:selenocysteine-specific translation elongation factor [Gemmobacter sp.]
MIVGTAGHIDHGKTALVKALTGVDADRLAEEKARGITIDLGFAYVDLGAGRVTGFVDVPGHERLIHTMLAGAGGIDMALLVVAADDGIMPQTREHLAILGLLGLTQGIVALTKADLAGPERRAQVAWEIHDALAGSGLAEAPILPVSALTGEGIGELRVRLAAAESGSAQRDGSGRFRFTVDRSFTLAGTGTVVSGMVLGGRVALDDIVTISPSGLRARVRGIHAQNRKAAEGLAGQRCALNLAGDGVTREAIHRGDMVSDPVLHAPTGRIDAELSVLVSEPRPVDTWFPARLHSHAAEAGVRVVPLQGPVAPGETGFVQLVLDRPLAILAGDRFILRDTSASRTLGGGRFLDLRPPARKRGTPERLALLVAARDTDPVRALAGQAAVVPMDLPSFLRDRGLAPDPMLSTRAGLMQMGDLVLPPTGLLALRCGLAETLAAFHADNPDLPGLGREKLRLILQPRLPKPEFLLFLRAEAEAGRAVLNGAFLRLPGHEVRLSPEDEALLAR